MLSVRAAGRRRRLAQFLQGGQSLAVHAEALLAVGVHRAPDLLEGVDDGVVYGVLVDAVHAAPPSCRSGGLVRLVRLVRPAGVLSRAGPVGRGVIGAEATGNGAPTSTGARRAPRHVRAQRVHGAQPRSACSTTLSVLSHAYRADSVPSAWRGPAAVTAVTVVAGGGRPLPVPSGRRRCRSGPLPFPA